MWITLSINGILKCSPGSRDHADRLTEPDHDRLARLIDREDRRIGDDQGHDDECGNDAADDIESHRAPPALGCGWAALGCGAAAATN